MSISEMLLPEFDQEMANTRKILERFPDDQLNFKPHEKSMEFARLASHVAELAGWAKSTFETELLDLPANFQQWIAKSRRELLENFDKNVAESRALLAKAKDDDFNKTWTLKFGGKEIFSMPRYMVYRTSVINHLVHHRAQLGVYLRLNDIELPGMYGPSADEMKFWNPVQDKETVQASA
jgi:uncharacterized damage-inducible protein DinB